MKITKFHQSCLLIQIDNTRILVDPGNIGYTEDMYENYWKDIDYIFITHKHPDHCFDTVINDIVKRDNAKLYISSEVKSTYNFNSYNIVKQGDILEFENFNVEVTKAVHGYLPTMKDTDIVYENIGYIFNDNNTKLYVTSDTISFKNDYNCDVICMPFNGNGLTLGVFEGVKFANKTGAKLIVPIHLEHPNPIMMPDLDKLKENVVNEKMECKMLDILETIDI